MTEAILVPRRKNSFVMPRARLEVMTHEDLALPDCRAACPRPLRHGDGSISAGERGATLPGGALDFDELRYDYTEYHFTRADYTKAVFNYVDRRDSTQNFTNLPVNIQFDQRGISFSSSQPLAGVRW